MTNKFPKVGVHKDQKIVVSFESATQGTIVASADRFYFATGQKINGINIDNFKIIWEAE